jgi:hypothetical protein
MLTPTLTSALFDHSVPALVTDSRGPPAGPMHSTAVLDSESESDEEDSVQYDGNGGKSSKGVLMVGRCRLTL